jgi:HlyD family secretion protein
MFRQKALVKLQSPEQLDEAQKIVRRSNLVATITAVAAVAVAIIWGVTGSVPEEGRGQGILLTPGSVVSIQAQAGGQILEWHVKEGDFVQKGQVLGILEQSLLSQQLDQNVEKLSEVEERNLVIGTLRDRFSQLERNAIARQREMLKSQIDYLQGYIERTKSLSENLHIQNMDKIEKQRRNLLESRASAEVVEKNLKKRLESYRRLHKEQLVSDDQRRDVRHDYEDARLKLSDLDLQIQNLDLKKVEMNETYLNTQNLIATRENNLTNLRLQLRELDNTIAQLNKSDSEFAFQQEDQLKEIQRNIERTRKQLTINREIKTEFSGRILELSASEGQVVSQGHGVARIDTRAESDELVALAYFQAKEGKLLSEGMAVRVSPSTVDRKQYGNIVGQVESISDYPVTVESVTNYVGNRSVAQQLIQGDYHIEVLVRLEQNKQNPSGYGWTSEEGPDIQLTAGTMADIWATVERRLPISYILPKLKEWGGV